MTSARDALDRLRAGNSRFVSGLFSHDTLMIVKRRRDAIAGQRPFAVILGCADSRVPVEMIFDQGIGDLFVVRVAGNIVDPFIAGSIEYAVHNLGARLVVVLGHTECGAVAATLDELLRPTPDGSPNLRAIMGIIGPSVQLGLASEARDDREAILRHAVRANVRVAANHLREKSEILRQLIQTEGLFVAGAEYSLETGVVDFFDGVPRPD